MKTTHISNTPRGPRRNVGSRFLALTLVITCVAGTAIAADKPADKITSKVDVTLPSEKFSGDEWRSLSLSASRILKHVDQALDALAGKKNDVASANIEKGLTLVKLVESVLPTTVVKTEIKGGGLTYDDQDSVKATFVPIYREYDQVDVLSEVTAQKQKAAAVPPVTPAEPKGAATEHKPAPPATAPQYTYAGFDYTGIKLNLRLAKRDLLLAQDFIKQKDEKGATLALQDIQAAGVIFEFSTMHEPLVRAMDNLRLAESEVKAKHPDQAKVALVGAVESLKNYEKLTGDSRSKEVAKLHKEVDDVSKTITSEEAESFSKKVSGWWSKVLSWF